jgi:hypothetical protein
MLKCLFIILYFFVALIASGLYGWYAVKIFVPSIDPRKRETGPVDALKQRMPFCWHVHQM